MREGPWGGESPQRGPPLSPSHLQDAFILVLARTRGETDTG